VEHIDGMALRKLSSKYDLSHPQIHNIVNSELDSLIDNTKLTHKYCNRYCGIFVVDGKYVKVRGYEKKIPLIYGIDYLTHDIPLAMLAVSENYQAYARFFRLLNILNYPLRAVISDDVDCLKYAVKQIYPKAILQACWTHYLENIRRALNIRTEDKYQEFFAALCRYVFNKHDKRNTTKGLMSRLDKTLTYCRPSDNLTKVIILDILKKQRELFAFQYIKNCPNTTNLIESYNSHLQGRLKTIKGFQSFSSAQRWLNGYIVRRRTKSFTDCCQRFKHLNGKTSLEKTLKRNLKLSNISLKKAPKTER